MDDGQRLLDSITEESEQTRGENDEALFGKGARKNREQSKMMSIRVPIDTFDDIERVAGKMDVTSSALVRGYILRGLSEESESVSQTIARVAVEVDKLQRIIGR